MKCPYCHSFATLEKSSKVYGKDYGFMYICTNFPSCDAYVGCHPGTKKPLGRLANSELRYYKKLAHAHFDPLWKRKLAIRIKERGKYKKSWARGSGYKWLGEQLGLKLEDCHIGMFDIETCKKVIELCKPYLKKE